MKLLLLAFLVLSLTAGFAADEPGAGSGDNPAGESVAQESAPALEGEGARPGARDLGKQPVFYVIPIRDTIGKPTLYAVRNGVKEAIAMNADFVVLDMNTPGGELGSTLEIMEILARFEGRTVTYVNREAVSAGALISAATHDIYFAPGGVIGAAAPVSGGGKDIDETMKQKVVSYLLARVRTLSREQPHRSEIVTAMVDANYELKIGDTVIKPKGSLLTLTDREAMQEYGDPPRPLFGAGIVESLPELHRELAGGAAFTTQTFVVTWSLQLAQWLTNLSPILLGLGGLLLYLEFKSPGFGAFGITGISLLLLVFFGHNLAGLSGHEPMLFFLLGVALVFVELLVLPGTIVFGAVGALIMLGSLLWGMADIWPKEIEGISFGTFFQPAYTLSLGLFIGLALFLAVMRFLPQTPMWSRLVLAADIHEAATTSAAVGVGQTSGEIGVVVSPLRPTGTIEIRGERFEARSDLAEVAVGVRVRVVRRADFVLIVEPVSE